MWLSDNQPDRSSHGTARSYSVATFGVKTHFILFLFFCHAQRNAIIMKTIINRLTNIEFKICKLLGRSNCDWETPRSRANEE